MRIFSRYNITEMTLAVTSSVRTRMALLHRLAWKPLWKSSQLLNVFKRQSDLTGHYAPTLKLQFPMLVPGSKAAWHSG